jgi:hemerythrin
VEKSENMPRSGRTTSHIFTYARAYSYTEEDIFIYAGPYTITYTQSHSHTQEHTHIYKKCIRFTRKISHSHMEKVPENIFTYVFRKSQNHPLLFRALSHPVFVFIII